MTRRTFLAGAAMAARVVGAPPPSKMGIATTSYMTVWKPKDTYEFLEHCHGLGAAGIQSAINADPAKLRARAEELGMWIEAIAPLPKAGDEDGFAKVVARAKAAGASCIRVNTLPGRRYETFSSLEDWKAANQAGFAALHTAMGVMEREKLPLAVENHKDWTVDEMAGMLKQRSSEYVGVCLDFGNNVSLLDDPMDVAEKLAPYAIATHVKDMAMEPYADGFLLSEVPLGEGYLDLKRMVSLVRQARPKTHFTLEMITRDPLEVPCLTDKYWATFPDRNGVYLARMLKTVQKQSNRLQSLPRLKGQTPLAQLRLEEENVKNCLHYAREQLDL